MVEYNKGYSAQEGTMATSSLIFKKIILKKEAFDNLVKRISNEGFQAEKRQGYHITQNGDDYIFSYYIYSFISSVNIFDEIENDFKTMQYELQDFIPFCLDYKNGFLIVIGNRSKINRVIEALGASSDYSITIDDIQLNPQLVLDILKNQNVSYTVSKIKVKDVQFSESVICDCTFKFVNLSDATNIIKKYLDNIIQYTIHLDGINEYSMTIYKSGAISIYKDFSSITIDDVRLFYPALIY